MTLKEQDLFLQIIAQDIYRITGELCLTKRLNKKATHYLCEYLYETAKKIDIKRGEVQEEIVKKGKL